MKEIIQKCLDQDRVAQKQLYLDHCDYLMAIVYRYVCDIEWSKDVLQNAFILIFKNLKNFDQNKASFRTWAGKIAINESLKYLRNRDKFQFSELVEEVKEKEKIFPAFQLKEVQNIIEELPFKYKTIVNLYHIDGYSHEEIGAMLGITSSSSRSQLSRAKKMLMERYIKLNVVI